jgi:hypothetical protein
MNNKTIFILLALFFIAPNLLHASDSDRSAPLLCAVTKVVDCGATGDCYDVMPEEVNISSFIKIDFAKKKVDEVGKGDNLRTTTFKNFEQMEGKTIIQGAEHGRAWSILVSDTEGTMSATVTDDGYVFTIFGACTAI